MERKTYRTQVITRASWIGIVGNGFLAILKIGFGIWGRSLALIGAGIDTVTDVAASVITLFAGRLVDKPPDEKHPFGHGRAETIATKLLAFLIFFAGTQLVVSTVSHIISESDRGIPNRITIVVAGISILGKIVLALLKWRAGRKVRSSMLIADAKNMTMDICISGSVLIGLYFSIRLNLPMVDTILGLCVGLWIIWVGYGIFMETNLELMDGFQDRDVYRQVCRAALEVEGVQNPHKMRIRTLNTAYVIDIDIEVDGRLSVQKGHEIARKVEESIHTKVDSVYDVNVHVEPLGNKERNERFGISQECLRKENK